MTQVIEVAANETLERKDPVKKAERAEARAKKKETDKENGENCSENKASEIEPVSRQERKALPKAIVHAIKPKGSGAMLWFKA